VKKLIVTAILCASTSAAFAMGEEVGATAEWLLKVRKGEAGRYPYTDVARCQASIDEARARNAEIASRPVYKEFGGVHERAVYYTITYEQGEAICREASYYQDVVLKDGTFFSQLYGHIHAFEARGTDVAVDSDDPKRLAAKAEPCNKAVAALVAANVPASTRMWLSIGPEDVLTVGELKTKLCDVAKDLGENYAKRKLEDDAKTRAPYLKVGIKGDKLELLLEYGDGVYLAGQNAPDDLRKYAKASTMFTWTTSDPDAADFVVHTIRKYVFKGNTLVKTIDKTYRKRRGEKLGGGPFR
jgi:hypothetical protein